MRRCAGCRPSFPTKVLAVRGQGYLVGVQLAAMPAPVIAALRERGPARARPPAAMLVRLLPPLNVSPADLDRWVQIFRTVLRAA
jgi:acetylornithine/succinyldiaminopimelate/putrescine aminotransferase